MNSESLKLGWKIVRFGDVVRQCKEKVDREDNPFDRYVAGGHMDSEDIHIRRWGEFGTDYVGPAFHRIFRKGQVLYGSRRTYLKKVAIAEFDGITANTTFVCETKDQNMLMQELLPFLMLTDSFTEHSIRASKGSELAPFSVHRMTRFKVETYSPGSFSNLLLLCPTDR